MTNIYYSNERPDSNFSGDWDARCQYCGRPHREHLWKENPDPAFKHRMPCEPQKQAIAAEQRSTIRKARAIYFAGWVAIPVVIAVAGFANWWVGFAFFLIALCKIGWRLVESFGSPEKWVPGYKERQEKKLRERHYVYHCERNPDGFARLRAQNLEKDQLEDSRDPDLLPNSSSLIVDATMRQIPKSSQKRLLRLISARADMKRATDAFTQLGAALDEALRYHLFLSMVVSYSRPFTNNHGIGSLLCEYPEYPDYDDADMNKRHTRLIDIRNNFLSHSSTQGTKVYLLAPQSINPETGVVCADYDYAVQKLDFLHPEYAPWLHDAVQALTRRLDTDLPTVLREIGGSYLRGGERCELDTGKAPFDWN